MSCHPVSYLLCYDIRDPKRLRRVHRMVRDWGIPIQFSVFEVTLTTEQRNKLLERLNELILVTEDNIRLYHISSSEPPISLGHNDLSDDLIFV